MEHLRRLCKDVSLRRQQFSHPHQDTIAIAIRSAGEVRRKLTRFFGTKADSGKEPACISVPSESRATGQMPSVLCERDY